MYAQSAPILARLSHGRSVRCRAIAGGSSRSRREKNVHWETQGHLELATGGTTTVNRTLSAKNSPPRLSPPGLSSPCSNSCSRLISSFAGLHKRRFRGLTVVCRCWQNFCIVIGDFLRVGCPPGSFPPRKARIGVQIFLFHKYRDGTHEILAILSY